MKDNVDLFFENSIKNKLGSVIENAIYEKYEFNSFIFNFFNSDLMARFYDDCTIFSQGNKYILALYNEEMNSKGYPIFKVKDIEYEHIAPAFWIGYLFAEWYYKEGTTGAEILDRYDFNSIYNSYDMLHTQTVSYAIDWIKNEYNMERRKTVETASRELINKVWRELRLEGGTKEICPKCGETPKIVMTPKGERTTLLCKCFYIYDCEINL